MVESQGGEREGVIIAAELLNNTLSPPEMTVATRVAGFPVLANQIEYIKIQEK